MTHDAAPTVRPPRTPIWLNLAQLAIFATCGTVAALTLTGGYGGTTTAPSDAASAVAIPVANDPTQHACQVVRLAHETGTLDDAALRPSILQFATADGVDERVRYAVVSVVYGQGTMPSMADEGQRYGAVANACQRAGAGT